MISNSCVVSIRTRGKPISRKVSGAFQKGTNNIEITAHLSEQTAQTSKQDTKEGFRQLQWRTGFFTISQAGSGFIELLAKSAAHETWMWPGLEHCVGNWTLLLAPCRSCGASWLKLQLELTTARAEQEKPPSRSSRHNSTLICLHPPCFSGAAT